MNYNYTTEVRKNNAHTTILLIRDGLVIGIDRNEVESDIVFALVNPKAAVLWDFNPVPDLADLNDSAYDPVNAGAQDFSNPEAWGELLTLERYRADSLQQ